MRWKRAGGGTGGIYLTLVSVSALLVLLGMIVFIPPLSDAKSILITAAQNGARVAALTGDSDQVKRVVAETLERAKLPLEHKGVSLFSVSKIDVKNGTREPLATVKVEYNAPILFPNLFAALGKPNSLPVSIPMSATQSYINESYFGVQNE